jgi:hypothetical protein
MLGRKSFEDKLMLISLDVFLFFISPINSNYFLFDFSLLVYYLNS